MEDTKQLTLVGNETPEQAEAIGLHYEIVSAAQAAASSLLDLGRKLKRMRDSGKYKALGFETFGDYTEQAVHIRQRQAYTYISVVETPSSCWTFPPLTPTPPRWCRLSPLLSPKQKADNAEGLP